MQLIDKVTSWDSHIIDSIINSISLRIDSWLIDRPFLHWLFNHPIMSLILGSIAIILILRLFSTIYRTVASTIDRMWLAILRSPLLLLKFIFGWEVKSQNNTSNSIVTNYEITNNSQQLQEISDCLLHIQQQQQQILLDIALLKERLSLREEPEINLQNLQLAPKKISSIFKFKKDA